MDATSNKGLVKRPYELIHTQIVLLEWEHSIADVLVVNFEKSLIVFKALNFSWELTFLFSSLALCFLRFSNPKGAYLVTLRLATLELFSSLLPLASRILSIGCIHSKYLSRSKLPLNFGGSTLISHKSSLGGFLPPLLGWLLKLASLE